MNDPSPETVLSIWYSLPHKDERDDEKVKQKLEPHYEKALEGQFDDWESNAYGRLALILLFDQVPRHLFRDQPRQYATDPRACELSDHFFENGFPEDFDPEDVFYAALPYLHAEDRRKQRAVNPVIHDCANELDDLAFMGEVADNYLATIEQFGRFPHRNKILGRESTAEEEAWLKEHS